MSAHKVECKCCGMMIVPRVITTRGIVAGLFRVGEGESHSVCPFCLSRDWASGYEKSLLKSLLSSAVGWYLIVAVGIIAQLYLIKTISGLIGDYPDVVFWLIMVGVFILAFAVAETIKRWASRTKLHKKTRV